MDRKNKTKITQKIICAFLAMMMFLQIPVGVFATESTTPYDNEYGYEYTDIDLDDDLESDDDFDFDVDLDIDDDLDVDDDLDIDDDLDPDLDLSDDSEENPDSEEDLDEDLEEEAELNISRSSAHQITTLRRTGVTLLNASFREGPNTSYRVMRTISGNTNVLITGRSGNFYRVHFEGTTGWVRRSSISQTRQNAVVTAQTAHVREGRNNNRRSLTQVARGQRLTITRRTENWSRVTVNGHTGWIRNRYLETENAARPGRTITNNVAVHTRARADSNVRHRLPNNTPFMIVQRTTDGWTQIRLRHENGILNGWVRTNQIERRTYSRRTVRDSALRSGPGASFNRLRTVPRNSNVTFLARVGSWYRVRVTQNGVRHYGWMQRNNLTTLSLEANVGSAGLNPTWGVIYGGAQLRRGAGTNYGVIRTISHETTVTGIRQRSGAWLELTYRGDRGWVHHDSIRIETHAPVLRTNTGRTNTSTALRRGAGNSYDVIRTLNNNANVTVLRQSGAWLQVQAGNDEGWVREYHVNTTTGATTNISSQLRSGPGTNYSGTRRLPSGINVTILRQRGEWFNISAEGQTDWIHSTYVNIRLREASVPNVTNRIGSQVNTVDVTNEAGLRLVVPTRRTIGSGRAFDALEGVRVEHVASNGTVTNIPITWHQASWTWRFVHNETTFTVELDGIMDNITPGTYERTVIVRRGNSIRARAEQVVVVR